MKWALIFAFLPNLCSCAALTNKSGEAMLELCEIAVVDNHSPSIMFFFQDFSEANHRFYECHLMVGPEKGINPGMRAELEPWCRAQIGLAMTSSKKCHGTKFADSASDISLQESLSTGDLQITGSVYVLKGETTH